MADSPAACNAVSLKLPEFSVDNPRSWFFFADNQFKLRGVTSEETKFTYCGVALPPHVICEISDLYNQTPNSTS